MGTLGATEYARHKMDTFCPFYDGNFSYIEYIEKLRNLTVMTLLTESHIQMCCTDSAHHKIDIFCPISIFLKIQLLLAKNGWNIDNFPKMSSDSG